MFAGLKGKLSKAFETGSETRPAKVGTPNVTTFETQPTREIPRDETAPAMRNEQKTQPSAPSPSKADRYKQEKAFHDEFEGLRKDLAEQFGNPFVPKPPPKPDYLRGEKIEKSNAVANVNALSKSPKLGGLIAQNTQASQPPKIAERGAMPQQRKGLIGKHRDS